MSTNLLRALQRVTNTINRQVRHEELDHDEVFESTRSPIERFASSIEPAARSEIIKILSRESLHEQANPDPSQEAFRLGTLGQNVLNGNTDSAINILEQGQEFQTARVTRALALAVNVGKTDVVNKLVGFSMKNSLDIPQQYLDQMLASVIFKVIRNHENSRKKNMPTGKADDAAIDIYETLLTFKKSLNTIHTRDRQKFAQATTKLINDHAALLIERKATPFAVLHLNLISNLDTSYYDSRQDEIGLAKIANLNSSSDVEDRIGAFEILKSLRTVEEEDYTEEAESVTRQKIQKNTKAINELVLSRITTIPRGALNILANTLNLPASKYDIRTDPQALALINNKLSEVISNPKYTPQQLSRTLREFRAILKSYSNTLAV